MYHRCSTQLRCPSKCVADIRANDENGTSDNCRHRFHDILSRLNNCAPMPSMTTNESALHAPTRRAWSRFNKARRLTPSRFRVATAVTISRVSDTSWPPAGPPKREPLLEYVRDVWTLRYVETNCTARIFRNDFGLELHVEHRGESIESRLSRYGIEPLLLIADQIRTNLIAQGWLEPTNTTH
jgi:hypothetical protein